VNEARVVLRALIEKAWVSLGKPLRTPTAWAASSAGTKPASEPDRPTVASQAGGPGVHQRYARIAGDFRPRRALAGRRAAPCAV